MLTFGVKKGIIMYIEWGRVLMKTVFITGGSRGIGRAMVELFSENGYNVAFTYKSSEDEAKTLAKRCSALSIKADSASEAEINNAVKVALDAFGSIDCLINNVAVSSFSLFTDITTEEWNDTFSINVTSAFLYTRALLPEMIKKKSGRIINVSSMWGIVGSSCEVAYSATKAALIGMTKALAKEVGPSGITVNAIAPGVIDTQMNAALTKEDIEQLKDETPLMRIGAPKDVAEAALFLASDAASFITGDVMNVSGGYIV